jgi:hypothetical protein
VGLDQSLFGGRVFIKQARRANGALYQIATAVWATIEKSMFGAVCAKRTLEGTNTRLRALRWEIRITAFTIGFQQ